MHANNTGEPLQTGTLDSVTNQHQTTPRGDTSGRWQSFASVGGKILGTYFHKGKHGMFLEMEDGTQWKNLRRVLCNDPVDWICIRGPR